MKGWLGLVLLSVLGCDDAPEPVPDAGSPYAVVAEAVQGGVLLAGWAGDTQNVYVGGDLGGGPGLVVREGADGPCVLAGAADRPVWWVHGASADDWYAVGERGLILHSLDGVLADESVQTPATFYGVWHGGDRVYAVGGDVRDSQLGELWVRESGAWRLLAGGLPGVLFKMWEDWIVGVGVAYQLEGDVLVPRPVPETARLLTVTGRGPDDVWAVGGATGPTMLHWDGTQWTEIEVDPFCATQPLNGVWTAPGADVWIAGNFGAVGRFDGTAWDCPRRKPSPEHFHGVFRAGDALRFVGGDLMRVGGNHGTVLAHGAATPWGPLAPCD